MQIICIMGATYEYLSVYTIDPQVAIYSFR